MPCTLKPSVITCPITEGYRLPGGTYFYTVNLLKRYPNDLLLRRIDVSRAVVRTVRERHPFHVHAWVV